MPKVSVVIPCFNHGQYIDDAVESILDQTFEDFEILIVNDGSTEKETVEKLRSYSKPKTTVFHTDNRGPAAARNYGIGQSAGEYILVLDADDTFESSYMQKATDILLSDERVGIVGCGISYFGRRSGGYIPIANDVTSFLVGCPLRGSALFRKVCWEQSGGYDEDMKGFSYEDWDFWVMLTKNGWSVHIIQEYLFNYRWHELSRRTESHKLRVEGIRKIVRNHKPLYEGHVEKIFCDQEEKIIQLKKVTESIKASPEYRIGRTLLSPIRKLQKLVGKNT